MPVFMRFRVGTERGFTGASRIRCAALLGSLRSWGRFRRRKYFATCR